MPSDGPSLDMLQEMNSFRWARRSPLDRPPPSAQPARPARDYLAHHFAPPHPPSATNPRPHPVWRTQRARNGCLGTDGSCR